MGDLKERSRAVTAEILHLMGISARVQAEETDGDIRVSVDAAEDEETLIGHRGDGVHSLQYIVSRIINSSHDTDHVQVTIDVGGYADRRERELVERAQQMADEARRSGREQIFEPLTAPDRRIVHRALTGSDDVVTYSLGEGALKKLVVGLAAADRLTERDLPSERRRDGRSGPPRRQGGESRPSPGGRSAEQRRGGPRDETGPSDGRVRDLIGGAPGRSQVPAAPAKKSTFKIVHMPPGMGQDSSKEGD